ncbi:segregation and condensation protein A [Alteribacillus iranensis]|uniref:Segregation and condensation protein A n=1 Tax=Alteribacillus iranensis TaxID=930128 RepID=A0A1I1ZLB8_9BACI|nr:segregation/condensation protein A [Alteribacillus iranensis]SFE32624.1 condensin subunit ScpA [Alteribacillus iranensis]
MKRYSVKIDSFEGPLDLLLHLVQQSEMDIYHIPLAEITNQYLKYVRTMQELELNIASEYLVMAATLLEIKSTMLLPRDTSLDMEEDSETEEEIRDELLTKLVEYKKYKSAAEELKSRDTQEVTRYSKEPDELEEVERGKEVSPDVTLFDMLEAYLSLKSNTTEKVDETIHSIPSEDFSMEESMDNIVTKLSSQKGDVTFQELFTSMDKPKKVVTFLAVLELMKERKIVCKQSDNFGDILLHLREEEEG